MAESDINTIPKLAQRAKADGLPISEYTIHLVYRVVTKRRHRIG